MATKIEWVQNKDGTLGETWNPVTGCDKVSPGCAHCYAEDVTRRFPKTFPNGFDVMLHPERISHPLTRRKPTMYFVNSMSDLFHEEIPFAFIDRVFAVMAVTPRHSYQCLTKRPSRAVEYFKEACDRVGALLQLEIDWPLPNVWMGVSVESQRYAEERIPLLLEIPSKVRFLSCEPLLSEVNIGRYLQDGRIHWCIAGGESGPKARPMDIAWARRLRDQCLSNGVSYFLKQIGGRGDKRGGDKALLDGRLWREMPA